MISTKPSDRTFAHTADKRRHTQTARRLIARSHDRPLGAVRIVSNFQVLTRSGHGDIEERDNGVSP